MNFIEKYISKDSNVLYYQTTTILFALGFIIVSYILFDIYLKNNNIFKEVIFNNNNNKNEDIVNEDTDNEEDDIEFETDSDSDSDYNN